MLSCGTMRIDLLIGAESALAGLTADFLRRGPGASEQHPLIAFTLDEGPEQQPLCVSAKSVCLDPQQSSSLGGGLGLQQSSLMKDDGNCFLVEQQPAGSSRAGDRVEVPEQHTLVDFRCFGQQADLRGGAGAESQSDSVVFDQQTSGRNPEPPSSLDVDLQQPVLVTPGLVEQQSST